MIKILRKKFKDMRLSAKMVLIHSVSASIIFIIALLATQLILHIFSEKLYEKTLQELGYYAQSVAESIDEIESISYDLAYSEEVQNQLIELKEIDPDTWAYGRQLTELRSRLIYALNPVSSIRSLCYIDSLGTRIEAGVSSWDVEEEIFQETITKLYAANGRFVMEGSFADQSYLVCGREIRNYVDMSLDTLGALVMTCDVSGIFAQLKSKLEAKQAELLVYSDSGIIYRDFKDKEGMELPVSNQSQGYRLVNYQGEKLFMCWLKDQESGWNYVNIFPYSDIYGIVTIIRIGLFLCFIVVFGLSILLMRNATVVITKPLAQLTKSMQIVENGDFQKAKMVSMDSDRKDEIGTLTREFQVMLNEIDYLIHENYQKQILLKDTKYQMLQAQINPHFLYNTLNALHWMVEAENNQDASKMIIELGSLLRAAFAKEAYATALEELQMVKSYITIQQFRYKSRVRFQVKQQGNLSDYMVPRMFLQPLVENALYYGVEKSVQGCDILVKVSEENEVLCFEVADTGSGMEGEELAKVQNFTVVPKGHGIGLKNIHERLKITYDSFDFWIESEPGKGTRVMIRVPKIKSKNQ
jgi:two-component system sensor histidine kinase YesM